MDRTMTPFWIAGYILATWLCSGIVLRHTYIEEKEHPSYNGFDWENVLVPTVGMAFFWPVFIPTIGVALAVRWITFKVFIPEELAPGSRTWHDKVHSIFERKG